MLRNHSMLHPYSIGSLHSHHLLVGMSLFLEYKITDDS